MSAVLPAALKAAPPSWTADSLTEADWLMPIPDAVRAELDVALDALKDDARPVHEIDSGAFELPAATTFMRTVRQRLESGAMWAVLDRLDTARLSKHQVTQAYWLLSKLLSQPVQQTVGGTMLYDVRDVGLGTKMKPGSGIRATITNLDINFHNDNCFNDLMPDFVGLLCLRAAKAGGVSKAISFHTVHNLLQQEHPEELARLYEPVWWDRHKEFAPGDVPYAANPVFDGEPGHPRARFSIYNITGGYRMRDEAPDPLLASALKHMVATIGRADLQCRFTMKPGQIQFVNNRTIGHARSDFTDFDEPDERRHLVRLWLRDRGTVAYAG